MPNARWILATRIWTRVSRLTRANTGFERRRQPACVERLVRSAGGSRGGTPTQTRRTFRLEAPRPVSVHLRYLITNYINDPPLDSKNQALFAFTAYNAGPSRLPQFRDRAKAMGLNPNIWFGNVENAAAAVVGRATVQYVSNIYKYYIAYRVMQQMEKNERRAMPSCNRADTTVWNARGCCRTETTGHANAVKCGHWRV